MCRDFGIVQGEGGGTARTCIMVILDASGPGARRVNRRGRCGGSGDADVGVSGTFMKSVYTMLVRSRRINIDAGDINVDRVGRRAFFMAYDPVPRARRVIAHVRRMGSPCVQIAEQEHSSQDCKPED